MTSGTFRSFPISSIIPNRSERQRRELTDIDVLADSIKRLGLIHPIVIQRDGTLVAGERRYTACSSLGWTDIPVQFADEIDATRLHAIELEENVKRVDLTWQDQTRAVEEYHRLQVQSEPGWNNERTAAALGIAERTVRQHLQIAKELGDDKIATAPKLSVARNMVERKNSRALTDLATAVDKPRAPQVIENKDFTKWAPKYKGPKFNMIHCDFPYGIDMDRSTQGGHVHELGGYADGADLYRTLLTTFIKHQDRFVEESAHCLFWFSMNFYTETVAAFTDAGWSVIPHPLIWHKSDNTGILSDPNRRPRHIYETALLMSRGDRKIVRAKSDIFPHASVKDFHISEKPVPVLTYFFEMLIDVHSTVFDPTAGSGTALRAAKALGASSIYGLEINPEFAASANERLA